MAIGGQTGTAGAVGGQWAIVRHTINIALVRFFEVVVWASGRGWAEDEMARAIREDGGDLCAVEGTASPMHSRTVLDEMTWGPHLTFYFFRNICRIMELSHYGTNCCGQHFVWQRVAKSVVEAG